MKTKTTIITLAAIASGVATSQADLTLSAPGTSPITGTGLNYGPAYHSVKNEEGENYKQYRITGYSYSLVAGRLWYTASNKGFGTAKAVKGLLIDHNGTPVPGSISVQTSVRSSGVNAWVMDELRFTARHKDDTKTGSHTLTTPIVIDDSNIELSFRYVTDMLTTGNSIAIHGEAINLMPIPTGSLNLAKNTAIVDLDLADSGYFPPLNWQISKLTNQSNDGGASTPGTGTGGGTDTTESSSDSEDAANIGLAKSNNGHGNNLDGIDVSNPGKSAAKWAEKGMFDTDYNGDGTYEDDESTGDGAAPSK